MIPRAESRSVAVAVMSVPIGVLDYEAATEQIFSWARAGESRYVCVSNVHMLMEGWDNGRLRAVLRSADLVTADGVPVVWTQRLFGYLEAKRVYGPDLTLHVCKRAAAEGIPIGLYGSTESTLALFANQLRARFPGLSIVFAESPPFRALSPEEDDAVVQRIRQSGARVLLVGLGCPKQEFWMAAHRPAIPAVMLGVGAAFDFIAGTKRQAPHLMQRAGLEWLFRLCTEPRRLWYRYLYHNPRFVFLVMRQFITQRKNASQRLATPRGH